MFRFRLSCNWESKICFVFLCRYLYIFKTSFFLLLSVYFKCLFVVTSFTSHFKLFQESKYVHPNSSFMVWGWNAGLLFTGFWVLVLMSVFVTFFAHRLKPLPLQKLQLWKFSHWPHKKGLEPTSCYMYPLLLLIVLVSLSVGVTESFLWVGACNLKKSYVLA